MSTLDASDLELAKLAIERDKLALEREKIKIEQRRTTLTVCSVLVASVAIGFNTWSARQNMIGQFQLQAARYLMESEGPVEVWAKAQTFKRMFPDYLPTNFGDRFNPETDFMNYEPGLRADQEELFQVLSGRCKSQAEIITLYGKLNPKITPWLNDTFKMKLPEPKTTEGSLK
jgi:hypothetical protein